MDIETCTVKLDGPYDACITSIRHSLSKVTDSKSRGNSSQQIRALLRLQYDGYQLLEAIYNLVLEELVAKLGIFEK